MTESPKHPTTEPSSEPETVSEQMPQPLPPPPVTGGRATDADIDVEADPIVRRDREGGRQGS